MRLGTSIITGLAMISAIVNCICPECGGALGVPTNQFRCRGQCGKDWRFAWNDAQSNRQQVLRAGDQRQVPGSRKESLPRS